MTTGQRIAQKRKEAGLSQETLGAELGVSRQSIYKWESDTALPEIDKLVALSRRFGVTVGWLLGVEEAPEAPPAPDSRELTDAQLKMVEEITERYIAAQTAPKPRKKWPYVLAALAVLCAAYNIYDAIRTIGRQFDGVYNRINQMESSVSNQVYSISSQVEEILTQQNSLVTDAKVSFVTCDLKANTVTFSVAVVPKTFVEGMTVEFLAENGEISSDVVGRAGEDGTNQRFSATLSIPLTDDIALSALLVLPDGTRQTQPLQTYTGLYSGSLPEVQMLLDADIQGRAAVENGTLTLPEPIEFLLMMNTKLHNVFVPRAEAVSTQVGLFKNKRLIAWAQPIRADEQTSYSGYDETAEYYRLEPLSIPFASGDLLEYAAVFTDEYGRKSICPSDWPLTLDSDGKSLVFPGSNETDTAAAFEVDTDISHWKFD